MSKRDANQVSSLLLRFINDTVGAYEMFRSTTVILSKEEERTKKQRTRNARNARNFLKNFTPKDGKVSLNRTQFIEFQKLLDASDKSVIMHVRAQHNHVNFRKAIFINLFSRYDAFILDLIREVYKDDSLLISSDRTLKYADISIDEVRSFKAVRKRFVEEEVERLRDKRTAQLDFIRKHGIRSNKLRQKLVPQLVEASERRNILVHHDGKVTHQYRSNLLQYGIEPSKYGVKLSVSEKYMERSVACVLSIAIETTMNLLRKSQCENFGKRLIEDYFGPLLVGKEYSLILSLASSVREVGGLTSELRNALLINIALAYKETGEPGNMKVALKGLSKIKSIYVKLARLCLLDEYDKALVILEELDDKSIESLHREMRDPANPVFHSLVGYEKYVEFLTRRTEKNAKNSTIAVK